MWIQRTVTLQPRPRGFHLITRELADGIPELERLRVGLCHLHILHTSASLTLNENADPSVRADFASFFDALVPQDASYWTHTAEGPDDATSHVRSSLTGAGLTLPIADGALALGTWQGVYLCEHRERGGERRVTMTAFGEE